MRTINICLMTKDPEYDKALSRSLQQYCKFFAIRLARPWQDSQTEHRECQGFPKKEKTYEINEEEILLTDDMNETTNRTVYLTDDPALARIDENQSQHILYKYQHISHLSNGLRQAYSFYSKSEMLSDETAQSSIISVCSSSGGAGCTVVALGVCQELARYHGRKVLYISMEEFESTALYFSEAKQRTNNLTRYLYSILYSQDAGNRSVEGYMLKDEYGVSVFYPAKGRNPLRELSGNEFVKFINQIMKEKLFDDLIVDCGSGLDESIVSAFQLSKIICHVTGRLPDLNRKETYLQTVANRCSSNDWTKILEITNLHVELNSEEFEKIGQDDKNQLFIEEDLSSFESVNGRRIISIDKAFGQGIRELVEHLA